jgi:hypothetical protein
LVFLLISYFTLFFLISKAIFIVFFIGRGSVGKALPTEKLPFGNFLGAALYVRRLAAPPMLY